MKFALAAVLVFGAVSPVFADHVVLKNGDRLTGRIVSASTEAVTLESEYVGRVTLQRDAVSDMKYDGQPAPQAAPAAAAWSATLNGGLDVSRGNSETATINVNGTATRVSARDRLGMFGTYLFSSIGSGVDALTTARAARGGLRYDHDLVGPLFGFGFTNAETDRLQLLDLRTVLGGGAGVHVVKTATTQLNAFGGVSYANDSYATDTSTDTTAATTTTSTTTTPTNPTGKTPPGLTRRLTRGGTPPAVVRTSTSRQLAEFVAGQDLFHQLSDNVSVTESLAFFPAVADLQDYRVAFDLTVSAQLNGWLQWNISAADRFLNIPPAGGAVQHDMFLSTGLGITFGNGDRGAYTGTEGRRPLPRR